MTRALVCMTPHRSRVRQDAREVITCAIGWTFGCAVVIAHPIGAVIITGLSTLFFAVRTSAWRHT